MGTVFRWGALSCARLRPQAAHPPTLSSLVAVHHGSHHAACAFSVNTSANQHHLPPHHCSVSAMATAASLSFGGAALLGLATLANLLKVRRGRGGTCIYDPRYEVEMAGPSHAGRPAQGDRLGVRWFGMCDVQGMCVQAWRSPQARWHQPIDCHPAGLLIPALLLPRRSRAWRRRRRS